MDYSFPLYSLFFFGGGIVCFILASTIWNRRPAPGIYPLTIFLLLISLWLITAGFEAGALKVSTRIIWTKIQYLSHIGTGVIWLYFVAEYAGSKKLKQWRFFIPIAIFPVTMLILAWTNEYHHLVWASVYIESGNLGLFSKWEGGPLYLVNPVYQYVLLVFGIIILYRFSTHKTRFYRIQLLHFIIGTSIPIIGSILYLFKLVASLEFDVTPFYLLGSALLYSVAVLRFRFMDVLPVAHSTLVTSMPDGILVMDAYNNIIELNPAAEQLSGSKRADLLGKRAEVLCPDEYKSLFNVTDLNQINHNEISIGPPESPLRLKISDVPLKDSRNRVLGKLVVIRNITDLKNALDTELQLRVSLEEEIKKHSTYTNAVVHELRTPLTSIKACSDMLQEVVTEKIHISLVQNIKRASNNLEQRVNELFELARGELGMIKIQPESIDLVVLIRNIVDEMSPAAAEQGLKLQFDFHQPKLPVYADLSRIRQVVMNLVGNSIKFTTRGNITISTAPHNDSFLKVQVEDTGCGMTEEQARTLFDHYKRKSLPDSKTGLGLGLTLSKIFVELHGGEIFAKSEKDKGTLISFTVPYDNNNHS